jgi:hypothetical protein
MTNEVPFSRRSSKIFHGQATQSLRQHKLFVELADLPIEDSKSRRQPRAKEYSLEAIIGPDSRHA